jgi:dTDP-4-amino-4,6-dideoxygalactose transaminase
VGSKSLRFNNPIYVTRPLLPEISEVMEKLEQIWETKWLTNKGKQHEELEKSIKHYLKVPFASLFNNGTIALIVAVQSLRLSGEVITTPFTFPATPHVLSWNNIRPIFCDIEEQTLNIDPERIESMITPKTTGILAVHVYGKPCDVDSIKEIADRYGLRVIYDGAHAFGTEIEGIGIGNFGDITMFSFHATKLFHTAEGGALSYNDPNLKERVELLKNFGIKNEEEVVMPGINGKMNEIQAGLGLTLLNYIDEERERRKIIRQVYNKKLKGLEGITLIDSPDRVTKESYQYFAIRINEEVFGKSRDYVFDRFKDYNVFTRKYFYPLCSDYSCYKSLPSSSKDNLPVANRIKDEVLCLPFYGGLSIHDADRICEILKSFREE